MGHEMLSWDFERLKRHGQKQVPGKATGRCKTAEVRGALSSLQREEGTGEWCKKKGQENGVR